MENFYKRSWAFVAIWLAGLTLAYGQTTLSGKVKDESGNPMPGVNIIVKGTTDGTVTDTKGEFTLTTRLIPPFTLRYSFIGYRTLESQVSGSTTSLEVTMEPDPLGLDEVVIIGQGVRTDFLNAPVTAYRIGAIDIRQTPAPDFYDALQYQPGVQVLSGSINFQSVNTRGFATIANVRFVQLLDFMDTSSPILNFPTGNLVGIGELDAESMDIIPGPSSALYGPNAFNGVLLMTSKSPFEYQGLSVLTKAGITRSDAWGKAHPLATFNARFAKAFLNDRLAIKANFSFTEATDWKANDFVTHRPKGDTTVRLTHLPYFDGLNLYGDETVINVPMPGFSPITRTGFREEDLLLNDYSARSMKWDAGIYYRIKPDLELSYNYRWGGGNTIYQGAEKYILRDFSQDFHRVELKGKNFFVRGYRTHSDAGNSYNLSALGGYANEAFAPSAAQWVPDYIQAFYGNIPGVDPGDHAAARAYADRNIPAPGSQAFIDTIKVVRSRFFQRNPPGAKFIEDSRLYHAEFNYRFDDVIRFAEVQVGGNFRRYDLFSNSTVFNEDPEGDGARRIPIDEYGAYIQVGKQIGKLKLTGSIRHDKNQNFDPLWTPRLTAVFSVAKDHNIRGSFQTGFRNPDTQAQFIYFPSSAGILMGGTRRNAERYGVYEDGAYTEESWNTFRSNGGSIDPSNGNILSGDPNFLVTANVAYVKPERLRTYEIGYKGSFSNRLLVDVFAFYNVYNDFIGGRRVISKRPTTHQGNTVPAGTLYSLYTNAREEITSWGSGVNLTYFFLKGYLVNVNYSYQDYKAEEDERGGFIAGFNTPRNRIQIGLSNRNINNTVLGFNINYRWQESFRWNSSFGNWNVPAFGVLDAMVSYRVDSMKATFKLGGTNLFGGDYRPNYGSGFIGQQYYVTIVFDELFK